MRYAIINVLLLIFYFSMRKSFLFVFAILLAGVSCDPVFQRGGSSATNTGLPRPSRQGSCNISLYTSSNGQFSVGYFSDRWKPAEEIQGVFYSYDIAGATTFMPVYDATEEFSNYVLSHAGVDWLSVTFGLTAAGRPVSLAEARQSHRSPVYPI